MLKRIKWISLAALASGFVAQLGCGGLEYWKNPWTNAIALWLMEDLFG